MEINDSFRVDLPVEETWRVLLDIERIAPCLPGAQLQEIEGDEYRGVVKVKVGPITAQYKGAAQFESRDDAAHTAVIKGSGRDTRGQGNASATITMRLEPDGDRHRGLGVAPISRSPARSRSSAAASWPTCRRSCWRSSSRTSSATCSPSPRSTSWPRPPRRRRRPPRRRRTRVRGRVGDGAHRPGALGAARRATAR